MTKQKSEERAQIEFVNWVHRLHPEQWEWLHHSPNGGKRDARTAGKMKLMGTKKGFPDLVLYEARGPFNGLVIEAKKDKDEKPTLEQMKWLDHFCALGYSVWVADGLESMQQIFVDYVNLTPNTGNHQVAGEWQRV